CPEIPGTSPSRSLPAFSVAVRGGGGGHRQGAALGGLSLLLVRQTPDGADDRHGDGGADHRAGDIHPPPRVVVADDVRAQGAGRVHRGAADRAGEQAQQRHGGADRDGGVVADAAAAGGGVQDDADQDRGQHGFHYQRPP